MYLRAACSILPLLFVGAGQPASAQRAGLWEAQTTLDGTPVGIPVRECRVAGAQFAAIRTWPANCLAEPVRGTKSGVVTQAECGGKNSGLSVIVRRELSGDLDQRFHLVETTMIDGVKEMPTTTVTFRYLGVCPSVRRELPGPDEVVQSLSDETVPERQSWLITALFLLAQAALMLVPIAAVGLVLRRRMKNQRSQATVANIVTDAAGAANVPVLATFTGVRGLPWWYGVALNNATPLLLIETNGIRYRVIRHQRRTFEEIACVDVRQAPGTVNLDFTFHGSMFTFAANVGTVQLAARVIALLPSSVPLSRRAQAFGTRPL